MNDHDPLLLTNSLDSHNITESKISHIDYDSDIDIQCNTAGLEHNDEHKDSEATRPLTISTQEARKNWFYSILLCPLNCITWPCICWLNFKFWDKKRHIKHDLAQQLSQVLHCVVAVFWSTIFLGFLYENVNEMDDLSIDMTAPIPSVEVDFVLSESIMLILLLLVYTGALYLLSIYIFGLITKFISCHNSLPFFVGLFSQIVAFGVKDMSFAIQDRYFSKTINLAILFECGLIIIALIWLILLRCLRKHLCPNRFMSDKCCDNCACCRYSKFCKYCCCCFYCCCVYCCCCTRGENHNNGNDNDNDNRPQRKRKSKNNMKSYYGGQNNLNKSKIRKQRTRIASVSITPDSCGINNEPMVVTIPKIIPNENKPNANNHDTNNGNNNGNNDNSNNRKTRISFDADIMNDIASELTSQTLHSVESIANRVGGQDEKKAKKKSGQNKNKNKDSIENKKNTKQDKVDVILQTQRIKTFNDMILLIDSLVWTVAIGFAFVECLLYGVSGQWMPLSIRTIHDAKVKTVYNVLYLCGVFCWLFLIWVIWVQCISWIESLRDRMLQDIFLLANVVIEREAKVSNNSNTKNQNRANYTQINNYDANYNYTYRHGNNNNTNSNNHKGKSNLSNYEPSMISGSGIDIESNLTVLNPDMRPESSCFYRCIFRSGYAYKHKFDRCIAFVNNCLGWSLGFTIGAMVYLSRNLMYRIIFAAIVTFLALIFEITRTQYIHKQIHNWYKNSRSKFKAFRQTMAGDIDRKWTIDKYQQTLDHTMGSNYRLSVTADYNTNYSLISSNLSSNNNINKFKYTGKETHLQEEEEESIDSKNNLTGFNAEEWEQPVYNAEEENEVSASLSVSADRSIKEKVQIVNKKNQISQNSNTKIPKIVKKLPPPKLKTNNNNSKTKLIGQQIKTSTEITADAMRIFNEMTASNEQGNNLNSNGNGKEGNDNGNGNGNVNVNVNINRRLLTGFESIDMTKPENQSLNLRILDRMDHKNLYAYHHSSYIWRKACGLLLAIVWEATLVQFMNDFIDFSNFKENYDIKLGIFVGVTILVSYCGIKFVDIKRSCHGFSNTDITKTFIRKYQQNVQKIQYEANKKLRWIR